MITDLFIIMFVRSRASTPGLSCVSASSSAFSESGNHKNNENDQDQPPPLIDIDG